MIKKIAIMAFVLILFAAEAVAGGERFVEAIFTSTDAVCVTEDGQMYGMPVGDGIRTGITRNRFELIRLKIHIIRTGMGNVKQTGSWQRLWNPVHGPAMAAPFTAGGDMVLIMYFQDSGLLLTKTMPTGEEPEEDWTKPEEPKNRMSSLQDSGFYWGVPDRWLKPPAILFIPFGDWRCNRGMV